jgi:hypothetical protein
MPSVMFFEPRCLRMLAALKALSSDVKKLIEFFLLQQRPQIHRLI